MTSLALDGRDLSITHSASCAPNASWLTFDEPNRVIYCLDEGLVVPNGSITSYSVSDSGKHQHGGSGFITNKLPGKLSTIEHVETISGPVSGVIFDRHGRNAGLAAAHYTGSSVTVWSIHGNGTFDHVQDLTYTLAEPGPNPTRQDAPHPHEALLDPTGKYILVPDLGADLVRIFSYDAETYE